MHQVINICPICGAEMHVTRIHCSACDTSIEGTFSLGRFHRLSREQLQFVEVFIKNRGNLKDVGNELGISYPTVASRLNDILIALGYREQVKPSEDQSLLAEQRREILERLARGEITADEAARALKGR